MKNNITFFFGKSRCNGYVSSLKLLVWFVSTIASFLLMLAVTGYISFNAFSAGKTRKPVDTKHIPLMFPVLVILHQKNGDILPIITTHARSYTYMETVPDYTLVVPAKMGNVSNRNIHKTKNSNPGKIEVHQIAHGKQLIKVVYSWHEGWNYIAGWYIASEKSYSPKYMASFRIGDFVAFKGPVIFVINLLMWSLIVFAVSTFKGKKFKKRRREGLLKE